MKNKEESMISEYPLNIWPQSIELTSEQLPEITKWEVGKEYEVSFKVKMISYEQKKKEGKGKKEEGRFELVAVKAESGYSSEQKDIAKKMNVKI